MNLVIFTALVKLPDDAPKSLVDQLAGLGWMIGDEPEDSAGTTLIQVALEVPRRSEIDSMKGELRELLARHEIKPETIVATRMTASSSLELTPTIRPLAVSPDPPDTHTRLDLATADQTLKIGEKAISAGLDGTSTKASPASAAPAASSSSECCDAATLTAASPAFVDPAAVWQSADRGIRGMVARDVLQNLYEGRNEFVKRSEWLVSPEMVLLDRSPDNERAGLAKSMLKARAGINLSDETQRGAEAELTEVRVELAKKGVEIVEESHKQMVAWGELASKGVTFLAISTIFSMLMIAYILAVALPEGKVSDAAAPIIVFVLALFAISPAVLLLRERPLEGLDKWSPSSPVAGGEEEKAGAEGSGEEEAKESTTTKS